MLGTSWHVGEPRAASRILGTGDAPKSLAWINSASCRYAAWKSAESPVMRVHRMRYRPVPSGRTDASGLSSHTTARSAREGEAWLGFGFGLGMGYPYPYP